MAFFFKVTFPAFLISISRCNKFILFRRKAFFIFNCIVFNFDRYWKYYGFILEEGPREITRFGLPSSLTDPDAAFVWGGNGKTYFFKGNNYWRYNEFKKIADDNYPRPISVWGKVSLLRKLTGLSFQMCFTLSKLRLIAYANRMFACLSNVTLVEFILIFFKS